MSEGQEVIELGGDERNQVTQGEQDTEGTGATGMNFNLFLANSFSCLVSWL
jgi:hypothetical protein